MTETCRLKNVIFFQTIEFLFLSLLYMFIFVFYYNSFYKKKLSKYTLCKESRLVKFGQTVSATYNSLLVNEAAEKTA